MPLEKPHFDTPEIKGRFESEGYDWEKIKRQLDVIAKREEVDTRLGELEGNIEGYYSYLKELVDANSQGSENSVFDFSKLSVEDLKKQAEDGIDGAKEYLEEKEQKLITAGEEAFKNSFIGKLLPESLLKLLVENTKEYATGKMDGIKGWFIGFLIGIIPGGSILLEGYKKGFGVKAENEEAPGDDTKEAPHKGENTGTALEGSERWINSKKDIYETAGFNIISLQSGIEKNKNDDTISVYAELKNLSIEEIHTTYFSKNLKSKDALKTSFQITTQISDEDLDKAILGIIGLFNQSFLRSSLGSLKDLKSLLYSDGELLEQAKEIFNEEELKQLQDNDYDYTKVNISIVARLVALYWKNLSIHSISYLSDEAKQIGSTIQSFLFGGELARAINSLGENIDGSSEIFPERVAGLFKYVVGGNGNLDKTGAQLRQTFGGDTDFSEEEKIQIDTFIKFRDEVKDSVPKLFGLGMQGFDTMFQESLNYGNLASLYILIQGRSLSSLGTNEKLLVHAWVLGILGENQGNYLAAVGNTLKNNSDSLTEDERNILLVLSYRIVAGQRSGVIKTAKNVGGAIHDTIKYQIPDELGLSPDTEDWIAWGIETLTSVGFWITLGKITPVGRTVMVITAGVGVGALYYFSGEAGYQQLDSIRRKKLDTFLEENIGGGNAQEIRQKIQDGDISPGDILSKVGDIDLFDTLFSEN